jgi:predicted DCC family thiol-disulfide oxidoreductase YuxK
MKYKEKKILFYDGECGFCNHSVQFVLKHETTHEILFTALQSEFSKTFFQENNFPKPNLSTFYFWENGVLFEKSTGALKLSKHLKMPFPLVQFFYIFPPFIRNYFYDFIAKRRHKLAKGFCALPSENEKKRFLS